MGHCRFKIFTMGSMGQINPINCGKVCSPSKDVAVHLNKVKPL